MSASKFRKEMVIHPAHYNAHPTGIECIEIAERLSFNLGNAVKHIWCAGLKGARDEDLRKAKFYLTRAMEGYRKPVSDMVLVGYANRLRASGSDGDKLVVAIIGAHLNGDMARLVWVDQALQAHLTNSPVEDRREHA